MKIVIVGGVAGGATTAARLRRLDEQAEIIVFERGEYISYANCGLPYYIGGTIPERDRLFVQTPEKMKAMFNIDVRNFSEVLSVNRENKTLTVKNVQTGEEYTESYDTLVLSPGAEPVKPPITGINSEGIFTMRNVPDTDKIKNFVDTHNPKRAVIVGAGFIGLEMAENLHQLGVFVTIVEMAEQVMNVLDYEMAAEVHQHLKTKNVEFYLKDGVSSFERTEDKLVVTLNSGRKLTTDMVILSIGVRPENKLAKEAGLAIGKTGGIVVDKYMATDDPNIYALGDAVEIKNPITGISGLIPLAGPANKQGRIVANNIVLGKKHSFGGTIGTAVAKVFDVTVATTGINSKTLYRENIKHAASITHSSSHAGYYPEAMPMSIKTLFDPETGKLLGAQIVGYDGVDKRIDLFASVLRNGGTVFDLGELEHAYAPPYSSAKDPVNIAGFVAENIVTGKSKHIHWKEVLDLDQNEIFLLDVRTKPEVAMGTIEGAVNIPVQVIRENLDKVPKDKTVVIFCGVGLRAYLAERVLRQNGFENIYNLSGGYKTYTFITQKQSNEDIFQGDVIGKDDHIYQGDPEKKSESPEAGGVVTKTITVDACGLQCPGPIMKLNEEMGKADTGDIIHQITTDQGFARDVQSWCNMTGNTLIKLEQNKGKIEAFIQKQEEEKLPEIKRSTDKEVSMVVFSDDLDKALASFIIANGAISSGKKVTMFFTFWGLSVIKKIRKPKVKKGILGRMFSYMLPKHSNKLGLSRMNFGGIGAQMIRGLMKKESINSLEEMIETGIKNGIRFVACRMSMDLMGVDIKELIEGVEVGGVASYLEAAGHSHTNLFI